ncbi:MAG: DUF427 domain-containing protein [Holophagales bacterium]|nr:DUF427 domain-containing protein [Holophagales bacterium]
MWQYRGQTRPPFAAEPSTGQESVWDYPRPPLAEAVSREVVVSQLDGGPELARSTGALKVMETASPPTYYLPGSDVATAHLVPAPGSSLCEWKGMARYWALASDPEGQAVAWSYDDPSPRFAELRRCFAFYPGRVACFLDGERVRPQPGGFYGGWVTDELVGPWKGEPGTGHW